MNYYAHDLSPLLDLGVSGSLFEAFNSNATVPPSDSEGEASTSADSQKTKQSPPRHRHDGTSPLPLGMDWSPPPRKGDGRDSIWPHDPRTGWSYCVTIPSWVILPNPRGSDPVVIPKAIDCSNRSCTFNMLLNILYKHPGVVRFRDHILYRR